MFAREDLKTAIKGLVEEKGLSLFDIDYPTLAAPTFRIYVWRAPLASDSNQLEVALPEEFNNTTAQVERRGVTLDECALVSRVISEWLESNQVEGSEDWLLEVSSPGVNRRLRAKEHFQSAIGERVKMKVKLVAELEEALGCASESLPGQEAHIKRASLIGRIVEVNDSSLVLMQSEEKAGKRPDSKNTSKKIKAASLKNSQVQTGKSVSSLKALDKVVIPLAAIEEARVDFLF